MVKISIIADENKQIRELSSGLTQKGFITSIVPADGEALELIQQEAPDLVLIGMDNPSASSEIWRLPQKVKAERRLPIIALISEEALGNLDFTLGIDDFVIKPYELAEVETRVRRILWRTSNIDSKELIKCGDLVIDLSRCEVSLSGRLVALTFKEYELLRFLASNKGKVFTRDALLNKVWGYDYYGGDRTVDVHIRRLRSKIEDSTHASIETVRSIGYRFKESPSDRKAYRKS